jgi:hypothetical protein
MMLAMALEADATQHNHFVITFDFLKSLLQDFDWVLGIADKKLCERANHTRRSFNQAFSVWIIARPSNNCSKCGFDLGSIRPLEFTANGPPPCQRSDI